MSNHTMRHRTAVRASQRGFIHLVVIGALGMAAVLGYYLMHEQSLKDSGAKQADRTAPQAARPVQAPAPAASPLVYEASEGRVQLRLIQVVADPTIEGGRRGVYLVTDNKTNREYIGITGLALTPVAATPPKPAP